MSKIRYALRAIWLTLCALGVIIVVLNVFIFNKLFGRKKNKAQVIEGENYEG